MRPCMQPIRNSVFVDNTAAGEKGAAVYLNKGNIYNTVLHSNKAWGLALNGTGNIVSNTIADNSKGGLYARGALVAEPCRSITIYFGGIILRLFLLSEI